MIHSQVLFLTDDHGAHRLIVSPFAYRPIAQAKPIVSQASDAWIRQHMSTSPEQERDDFAANVRRTLQFIVDHPDWRQHWPHGRDAIEFVLNDRGDWVLL